MADIKLSSTPLVDSEEVALNTAPFHENETKDSPPGYENTYSRPEEQKMFREGLRGRPSDYLTFAILVTIFCCTPCGVIALVNAVETRIRSDLGDYENASRFSRQAKRWAIWSLAIGGIIALILLVLEITYVSMVFSRLAQLETHMQGSPQFEG